MPSSFNPLEHPIIFASPRRLTQYSAWQGHIPFAMLLVELLKPRLVVELGTYYGDSYCAFCQAVQELCLPTQCYAIDTWQGDPQTELYGPEVVADLREHHDRLYGSFSQLIQSTFDEAQPQFANGSIDLLHIDGYHTYDAVKHDFECWLPKLSSRSVVLLHDIYTRQRDFGAWRFWDEIKTRYPSFEFFHGYGLGILAVGSDQPQALLDLLAVSGAELIRLRNFFFQLSYSFWAKGEKEILLAKLNNNEAQVITLTGQSAEKERLVQDLNARLTEQEQTTRALQVELVDKTQRGQALQQTVDEQTGHLDALTARVQFLSQHEQELRSMLLNVHEQLAQRDDLIQQLRNPDSRPSVRPDEVAWLRSQIKEMQATRIWQLGRLYWRVHAWLTHGASPKR